MNEYAKAIKILHELESGNTDLTYRDIIYRIAQTNPSVIVKSVSVEPSNIDWKAAFVKEFLIPNYQKIPCIKIIRYLFDNGLKEAKEYVEQFEGSIDYGSNKTCVLHETRKMFEDFKKNYPSIK